MRFGRFGSASARRGGAEFDGSEGFHDFIDYNVEAEALGFHSPFVVEHHFTGYGQVSANLLLGQYASLARVAAHIAAYTSRDAGVGYVLLNGGGSGGGARGRESLRRFARDVMPMFAD
jgi:hypothetical protein